MADYGPATVIIGARQHLVEVRVVEESIRSIITDAIVILQHVLQYRGAIMRRDVETVQRESKPEGQERVVGRRFGGCEYKMEDLDDP